jgi:DNA-binding GntR family transcriptional regulator
MARSIAVERKSLSAQVADTLRELIISNTYAQGHQLRQDEVAKRLGVSHIPVRAAFQLLEAEGLITNVPYKGAMVTRLSITEIEEYFDIRATLEAGLLKRAIKGITPEVVARARKIVEKMDSAPPLRWGEYNWKLHEELYSPANRPITLEFVRKIHDNLDRYVRIQLSLAEENRQRAHKEHIQLIDLCEAGEPNKALRLLFDHISGVRDDLVNHLEQHPPGSLK